MREPEGGWLSRVFTGRHEEREQIKTRLLQHGGILLLFGQPLVGKASLARQVAEELQDEQAEADGPPWNIHIVDCKGAVDWSGVMLAICRALALEETVANDNIMVGAIVQRLRDTGAGGKTLLLLLHVHGLSPSGSDLHSLHRCLQSLSRADVITVLTSRRQLRLTAVTRVKPLTLEDSVMLLRHHAPEVAAEEFRDLVQRYCHGLPPLVLQMADLVRGDAMLAYTAEELEAALEEDPGLLMEGLGEEASALFSSLSPEVQGHVSSLAQLLDGSFSMEALGAVVGVEGARLKTVMRKLHDEAPLLVDSQSQRMCVEPLVLHHVRKLGHVTADDQARLRVVTFLGRVLTRAEHDLYVSGQDTVYGHLHGDWPQLQHVLRQALHCTTDTYHAYLQVAMKADKLLAKCFPQEALTFYNNMAAAAMRFGTSRDQAVLQGLIGMAVTLGKAGTGWEEALCHYHAALPVLQQDRRSVSYLRLLCDLGFSYFRLNRLQDSDRYLQEAMSISQETEVEDEKELIFHLLRARSFLALPSIFRGHLAESKVLLLETLELCEQHAPHHPDKPVLINSLGLVFERSGEDQDIALHFYQQSLVERRRYASVAPGDLVISLNNVGMQHSRRGRYDQALIFLDEAAAIRTRQGRWHYHTALTQQHLGQVSLQMGDYKRAERHLLEAACVYSRCTPKHDVRGKVALCLAHLYVTPPLRDVTQCRRYLQEVRQLAQDQAKDLSDSGLLVVMSAVEHLVQLEGWNKRKGAPLLHWTNQLLSVFDGDPSEQLTEHQRIINNILAMMESGVTEAGSEAMTSRVMTQCQMCKYLSNQEDARDLWREVEKVSAAQRNAIPKLRASAAVRTVLALGQQHTLDQFSQQHTSGHSSQQHVSDRSRPSAVSSQQVTHAFSQPRVSSEDQSEWPHGSPPHQTHSRQGEAISAQRGLHIQQAGLAALFSNPPAQNTPVSSDEGAVHHPLSQADRGTRAGTHVPGAASSSPAHAVIRGDTDPTSINQNLQELMYRLIKADGGGVEAREKGGERGGGRGMGDLTDRYRHDPVIPPLHHPAGRPLPPGGQWGLEHRAGQWTDGRTDGHDHMDNSSVGMGLAEVGTMVIPSPLNSSDSSASYPEAMMVDQPSHGSFTSSDPPSTRSSDLTSGPSSGSSGSGGQEASTLFCRQLVLPLQETARDQSSHGFRLGGPEPREQEKVNVVEYLRAAMAQGAGGSSRTGPVPGFVDASTGVPDPARVGMSEVCRAREGDVGGGDSSGPAPPPAASQGQAETDVYCGELQRGQSHSAVRTDFAQPLDPAVPYNPTHPRDPGLPSDPALQSDPSLSRPHCQTTRVSSSVMSQTTVYTSHPKVSPALLTSAPPPSALTTLSRASDSDSPQLTLQGVVTCAQQLVKVLHDDDVVTSDQRRALEKLASLTTSDSDASSPEPARLDQETLMNLMSCVDQAARLSQFQPQGSQTSGTSQSVHSAHTWHRPLQPEEGQLRPTTQTAHQQLHQSQPFIPLHQSRPIMQTPDHPQTSTHLLHLSKSTQLPHQSQPIAHSVLQSQFTTHASHQSQPSTHPPHQPVRQPLNQSQPAAHALHQSQPPAHALHQSQPEAHALYQSQPAAHALHQSQPVAHALHQSQPAAHALHQPQPVAHAPHQSQPAAHALHQSQPVTHAPHQSQPAAHALHQSQPVAHALHQSQPVTHALHQSQPVAHALHQPQPVAHALHQSQPVAHALHQSQPTVHLPNQSQQWTQASAQQHLTGHPAQEPAFHALHASQPTSLTSPQFAHVVSAVVTEEQLAALSKLTTPVPFPTASADSPPAHGTVPPQPTQQDRDPYAPSQRGSTGHVYAELRSPPFSAEASRGVVTTLSSTTSDHGDSTPFKQPGVLGAEVPRPVSTGRSAVAGQTLAGSAVTTCTDHPGEAEKSVLQAVPVAGHPHSVLQALPESGQGHSALQAPAGTGSRRHTILQGVSDVGERDDILQAMPEVERLSALQAVPEAGHLAGSALGTDVTRSAASVFATRRELGTDVTRYAASVFATRREPVESDESAEPQCEARAARQMEAADVPPVRREATENDERLDHPEHVCTSVDCSCSLRPDS